MKRILLGIAAVALAVGVAFAVDTPNVLDKLNISFSTATVTGQLAPANGGSGVANSKNLTWSNSLTLAGTDATTMTFPTTSASIARTDTGQTFTGAGTSGNQFGAVGVGTAPTASNNLEVSTSVRVQSAGTSAYKLNNGSVEFGIGAAAGSTAILQINSQVLMSSAATAAQFRTAQSTTPTCTVGNNCGTGGGTIVGTDTAGVLTLGTTPASGFVITFNGTWAAAPACVVEMYLAGMVVGKQPLTVATTTTTLTVVTNGTAPATGDKYVYHCIGTS